jgi:tRNA threonylcarbamoyl adenosine modification protein (Sua5/YciO/YrdC/YwlC family)
VTRAAGIRSGGPSNAEILRAAEAVEDGELIVLPTDTVYGLGARPDEPRATRALFAAKGRPSTLALPVLAATGDDARSVGVFDERAERLAATFWPGPLTLVVPRTETSRSWDLGDRPDTVGLRVPSDPLALSVLRKTGPLAVTSANRSGEPEARTCDEARDIFGSHVAVYLRGPEPLAGRPSTVLDLSEGARGGARILRRGALTADELARCMGSRGPLLDSRPSS